MTGDEFTARYRLREQLGEGDVVSFRATDGRGSHVLVHVVRGEPAEPFDPEGLNEVGRSEVREVLEVEGLPVVVTEPIGDFTTFEAWVEARRPGESEPRGAFTRIFRVQPDPAAPPVLGDVAATEEAPEAPEPAASADAPAAPEVPETPTGSDATPPTRAVEAQDPAPASGPGEFTRRFEAVRTPPPAPQSFEAVRPPDRPTAEEQEATGVFTRIMGAKPARPGSEPRAPASPPPPSSAPPPRSAPPPSSPPPPPAESPPPAPSASPSPPPPPPTPHERPRAFDAPGSPGERPPDGGEAASGPRRHDPHAPGPFTLAMRGYRQPEDPPPSLEPSDYQVSDDYLSRLHGRGEAASSSRDESARPPPPGAPPPPDPGRSRPGVPPPPSGPSEYTRIIKGGAFGAGRPPADPLGARGAPPPAPAPPPPPGNAPSGRATTGLVVGLVLVIAAIVAVLLYFAMRPPS